MVRACSVLRRQAVLCAAGAALLALGPPALAEVKGFEPMSALKGKDYGKERQRQATVSTLFCIHLLKTLKSFSQWPRSRAVDSVPHLL